MGKKTACKALNFLRLNRVRRVLAVTLVELLTGKNNPWKGDCMPVNTDSTILHGQRCVRGVDDSRCVVEVGCAFVGTDTLESESRTHLDWAEPEFVDGMAGQRVLNRRGDRARGGVLSPHKRTHYLCFDLL